MKWFKLLTDLPGHRKRFRFEALAETKQGLHYIVLWFCYVATYAEDGDVSKFLPSEIARACEWTGDAQKFWDALFGAEFIKKTKKGFEACSWYDENGHYLRDLERIRLARESQTERKQFANRLQTKRKQFAIEDRTGQDITRQGQNQNHLAAKVSDSETLNLASNGLTPILTDAGANKALEGVSSLSDPSKPQDTAQGQKKDSKPLGAPKKAIVVKHPMQDSWWQSASEVWATRFPGEKLAWPGQNGAPPVRDFAKMLTGLLERVGLDGALSRWTNHVQTAYPGPSLRSFIFDPDKYIEAPNRGGQGAKPKFYQPAVDPEGYN